MEKRDELAITYSDDYVKKPNFLLIVFLKTSSIVIWFLKNNCDVNPIEQLEIFDQLYEEFNLRKHDSTKVSVNYYPADPWEKFGKKKMESLVQKLNHTWKIKFVKERLKNFI